MTRESAGHAASPEPVENSVGDNNPSDKNHDSVADTNGNEGSLNGNTAAIAEAAESRPKEKYGETEDTRQAETGVESETDEKADGESGPVEADTTEAPELTATDKTPDVTVETPDVTVESPDVTVETPDITVETPDVTIETPDVTVETPDETGQPSEAAETPAPAQGETLEALPATPASATSAASSRRGSLRTPSRGSAKVDNTSIFKKTFDVILESKEAHKNPKLKTATQNAIDSLNNSASRDPHVLFNALKLACETTSNDLKSKAVDLFAKLFDHASFDDEQDRVNLTDASVDVIASCFDGEGTDPELELQVVRALIHSIILMPTHGASLLKAVRQIYNVFIFSLTPRNQAVAQGTLTQVIGTIFQRVNDAAVSKHKEHNASSQSVLKAVVSDEAVSSPVEASPNVMTLERLENLNGDSADSARVNEANLASEKDEDLVVKDAFLIFRAMCKLSIKDIDTDNIDMRSHSVRSKLLSLHIIHTILKNNIDIFLSNDVVILSSNSDEKTKLIDAVRGYLCQALIRNAASSLAPVFELTLEIFWLLISNLRSDFKMEIPVMWEQIYFPVAEMKTSTAHQKRYLLSIIERLCNDSRCIIEFYLNYDCDSNQPNICEAVIDYLTRLSLARVETTAAQKMAYRDNKRNGVSLYDISKIDNLTTATMSSKPPEPDIYNHFPLEYSLKLTSLNCSVAFLRSLYSWAQKGISTSQKLAIPKLSTPQSPYSSRDNSRNPSFVGKMNGTENETDDPEQFETQKQRKRALLEGTRQFSQKPKKGIAYFLENGFIDSDSPEDIALFLLKTDTLDKAALGDYLGEGGERNVAIMHAFVDQMDFTSNSFVDSLRTFLQSFRLPGEGQKIDRFMLKFAERYVLGNPKVFSNADTAYVLAYSAVMLNTDQHSKQVKNRMTVDNFIMNNSGIDDGKDLPRAFLEQVFNEIQSNEIKLQSEHHAALLAGDQLSANNVQTGFFSSRDLNKEAYMHASKEMSSKTEKLVKSLGKKLRSEDSSYHIYYAASHVHHVRSIFDTTWMSILAGLTAPFKEYEEEEVIRVCLEGIKLSIKISCMFELQYAKKSFIGALVQFQNLNNIEDIKHKNVDAIYIMLDIAVGEGNGLQKSWLDILTSISQLERLQLIAKGIDRDSIPDVSVAKLVNRNSIESTSSQPSGFFSSFSRDTSASHSASVKYHNQQLSEEAAKLLTRTELSVAIDKVFNNSSELSGEAIKDFVEALSKVATEEIESSGQSSNPRMFSLQKVVDICYYNMGRIRLQWSQLWVILGEIFNVVGCNPNLTVDFFALDSLRQLSMRFMEIDELAHFKFQKEFLKPFQHIMTHNNSTEVKDMVLECINNMILAKASRIKSGWKTIFEVLTAAAKERSDTLVTKSYKMAFNINKEFKEEVVKQDSFSDLVACFTEFAKNDKFQKIGLLSLEVLSRLIVSVASITIESDKTITANGDSEKYETLNKLWFPILFGLNDVIMTGEELEVRSLALTHFFDVLLKYGDHFETDFWLQIYHRLLCPIFGILASPWCLKSDEESMSYGSGAYESDRLSFWVSTTLIQALNSMVSLFTQYFDALTPILDEFMSLLINCICQDNDTIARTGTSCFKEFVEKNSHRFNEAQWDLIVQTFENLFDLTTAKELFLSDPLKKYEDENADVVSLNINDDKAKGAETNGLVSKADNSTIVVKCVWQLMMIETLSELSSEEAFYDAIPDKHLLKLSKLLYHSYDFAKRFNDDYDLRVRIWNAGVLEKLPSLLKQESMSAAALLNLMFRIYCDDKKCTSPHGKEELMSSTVPVCNSIVERFVAFDEATQQKGIAAWRPVICEVYEGYIEMDEADFAKYAPSLYRSTLEMFNREITPDLRKCVRSFLNRIGDAFVKETA